MTMLKQHGWFPVIHVWLEIRGDGQTEISEPIIWKRSCTRKGCFYKNGME